MARFVWRGDYELGNETIDSQHRQLLEAANILHGEIDLQKEDAVLKKAFDFLLLYTKKHFEDEERYFSEIGSHLLHEHKSEHEALTAEIEALWQEDRLGFIDGMKEALELWVENRLVPHMMEADQAAVKEVAG